MDALPPEILRELIRNAIEQYLPDSELDVVLAAEKSERDLMLRIAGHLRTSNGLWTMVHK